MSAKQITLRALNGGDGRSCDLVAWGLARFIKAGATDPLAGDAKHSGTER
jgi:hypothetical protein